MDPAYSYGKLTCNTCSFEPTSSKESKLWPEYQNTTGMKNMENSYTFQSIPESKVHGANMGPTWALSVPDGPHVGPMNLAVRDVVSSRSVVGVLCVSPIVYSLHGSTLSTSIIDGDTCKPVYSNVLNMFLRIMHCCNHRMQLSNGLWTGCTYTLNRLNYQLPHILKNITWANI